VASAGRASLQADWVAKLLPRAEKLQPSRDGNALYNQASLNELASRTLVGLANLM
jgi:hypothetical protein